VGAAFAGVDAVVAEAPFAFVALLAFPVAVVGKGEAYVAEHTGLETLGGVVVCEAVAGQGRGGLDRAFSWWEVFVA
jgi:hypothetical protein